MINMLGGLAPVAVALFFMGMIIHDVRKQKRLRRNREAIPTDLQVKWGVNYIRQMYEQNKDACAECFYGLGKYVPARHVVYINGNGFGYRMCEPHYEERLGKHLWS